MRKKQPTTIVLFVLGLLFGVILPIVFGRHPESTPLYWMTFIGRALLIAALISLFMKPKAV